jgi:hypothetical protein
MDGSTSSGDPQVCFVFIPILSRLLNLFLTAGFSFTITGGWSDRREPARLEWLPTGVFCFHTDSANAFRITVRSSFAASQAATDKKGKKRELSIEAIQVCFVFVSILPIANAFRITVRSSP